MPKNIIAKIFFLLLVSQTALASRHFAAVVIDADTGRVIHETEAAQRWYPASLTKVMTLYMTFAAIESGRLSLHDILTVSKHASVQPSSRLGLRNGQTISVENAIMAVTTRSANDAAVLLAETLGGTEEHFASMMTHQAHQLGMSSSSFQNASGLPDEGQISSARDLAILSQALIRDFPGYYPYFSMTEFGYKGRVLPNTNRILKTYPDADGMKTGFTCGSGYNLIASAKRNGHRVIGVILGAHSSAERFAQMGNLLDLGFERAGAAINNPHVSQLKADVNSPPPFQLSSNRCAGSAMQMGADTGQRDNNPEPTVIPRAKFASMILPKHDTNNWAVSLAVDSRKDNADVRLKQARVNLGSLAKLGQPQIAAVRLKTATAWRTSWSGLSEADARIFCSRLHAKNPQCTVIPGRIQPVHGTRTVKSIHHATTRTHNPVKLHKKQHHSA